MSIDTMSLEQFREMADIVFQDVFDTPTDILARYPPRDNASTRWIGRFAPSPTGFIHIGSVFAALVNRMATLNGGIFILRIEDTDQKREVERGVEKIVETLAQLDLLPDEGPYTVNPIMERGEYGPYIQSHRLYQYRTYMKDVMRRGLAYPCFMTNEELDAIRNEQAEKKAQPGIHGAWARSRQLSLDDVRSRIERCDKFVIRLKAYPREGQRVRIHDHIRGDLDFPANNVDTVLLKSDGLPTYHFAHVVDELLMRINLVLRGDEWIASLPLHVQLHDAIQAPLPAYAHFGPIAKMEGTSRRKLSKRKDPEAAMSYYYERGYPSQAVLEYLLTLASSSFEEWRVKNPGADIDRFPFDIEHLGKASMLFDIDKLASISKDVIAGYSAEEIYTRVVEWATLYHAELLPILKEDPEYTRKVLDVGRFGDAPRKDLAKWEDVVDRLGFFFDPLFDELVQEGLGEMPGLETDDLIAILEHLIDSLPQWSIEDKDAWLSRLRQYASDNNYAARRKDFEKYPELYRGWFGDVMMVFRVALSGKTFSPDLYEMVQILGPMRVERRLRTAKGYCEAKRGS